MHHPISKMFSDIAGRYDFVNRALSFGRDKKWRRYASERLRPLGGNARILDLCAGTLDFGLEAKKIFPDAEIVALDFCLPMLKKGLKKQGADKIKICAGDALKIPFREETFDAVLCGFGLRNLDNIYEGLCEARRALKNGGKFAILEFFRPETFKEKLFYSTYGKFIIPAAGALISDGGAYKYLASSVKNFYTASEFEALMREVGFGSVCSEVLTFGSSRLMLGAKL